MKKLMVIFMAIALCACLFCGCATSVTKVDDYAGKSTSMFVTVEETNWWYVAYHRDTKVMYAISYGYNNSGAFTVLVNPDGTPMIWEGN